MRRGSRQIPSSRIRRRLEAYEDRGIPRFRSVRLRSPEPKSDPAPETAEQIRRSPKAPEEDFVYRFGMTQRASVLIQLH